MPRCQWLCSVQANAEPDLQQTGDRLKGLIAGMVSGVLDLVAGPSEQQQEHHSCNGHQVGALLLSAMHQQRCSGWKRNTVPDAGMQAEEGCSARFGRWIKVYEKQQEGRGLGGSGMRMT